jgi:hypothetical protein
MRMTEQEAFQLGFFKRAAERGVPPAEAARQMEKAAAGGVLNSIVTGAGSLASLAGRGALLGLAIPAGVGLATGFLHAKMDEVTEDDLDRLKKKQLVQTLRMETQQIRDRVRHMQERAALRAKTEGRAEPYF